MNWWGFLKGLIGVLVLLGLGVLSCADEFFIMLILVLGKVWGLSNLVHVFILLFEGKCPEGMVEIFFLGGMFVWETFYMVPEFGDPVCGGFYAG